MLLLSTGGAAALVCLAGGFGELPGGGDGIQRELAGCRAQVGHQAVDHRDKGLDRGVAGLVQIGQLLGEELPLRQPPAMPRAKGNT